jgi:hypothetical protein
VVLAPGFYPLTKWLQVLYKKIYTCLRAKLLGGRRRAFVSAITVFADEEISSSEECLSGLFKIEVFFFVLFVIVVNVFEDPTILENGRSGGFLVILAEDVTLAFGDVQKIRFVAT